MTTTTSGVVHPASTPGVPPDVVQDMANLAASINDKILRTASSQTARNGFTAYEGQPVVRTDLRMLELLGAGSGVLRAIFGPMKIVKTLADTAIDDTDLTGASKRGIHPAVTNTRPFGTGVPFQGLLIAKGYCNVQATSVAALSVGDPDDVTLGSDRAQNAGSLQELRGLLAIDWFDTGSSDTYIYQPKFKAETGTITPSADSRLTYSICVAMPKAL